jgi:hypothetical protein
MEFCQVFRKTFGFSIKTGWLTPVILDTQEAEIRRIAVGS